MLTRRLIVGVVGPSAKCPDETYVHAVTVGAELAALDAVVLTGGHPEDGDKTVKKGALQLARRQISILPGDHAAWSSQDGGRRLVIELALTNYERNLLTGQIPDAIIALPGNQGTLSEVACALAAGRPVVLLGGQQASPDAQLTKIENDIRAKWGSAPDLAKVVKGDMAKCHIAPNAMIAAGLAVRLGGAESGKWHWDLPNGDPNNQVLGAFPNAADLLCYR